MSLPMMIADCRQAWISLVESKVEVEVVSRLPLWVEVKRTDVCVVVDRQVAVVLVLVCC